MDAKRKPVIGLTGAVGSGKSLVASQLVSLGCAVVNADELARDALEEPDVRRQLVDWWGSDVLNPDGRIHRPAVARIVFQYREELARLEGLVHPKVKTARRACHQQHQSDPSIRAIVEDCPLLLEKGLDKDCDVVIFVACDRESCLRRVNAVRGWTAEDLRQREKYQLALDIKAERADYIVENNAGPVDCLLHVRRVFSQVMQTFTA